MRHSFICWVLALFVIAGGCDRIGGGIAGAGRDFKSRRQEADNYKGTVSPLIQETEFDNSPDRSSHRQHWDDVMRTFPASVEQVGESWVQVPGTDYSARYKRNSFGNNRFELRRAERELLKEKLPAVFNMHTVRLGAGTLGGREIIMIRNKSRASTGRHFVAIYGRDGEVLYRKVLRSSSVWDINASPDAIEVFGAKKTIKITLSERKPKAP